MDRPSAPSGLAPSASAAAEWSVVCLCAEWCGVCREYEGLFKALESLHPGVRFLWIDVEDREDIVEDFDVETFPSLLIAQGPLVRFLGPLLPQSGVLDRLLRSLMERPGAEAGPGGEAQALWARVRAANV